MATAPAIRQRNTAGADEKEVTPMSTLDTKSASTEEHLAHTVDIVAAIAVDDVDAAWLALVLLLHAHPGTDPILDLAPFRDEMLRHTAQPLTPAEFIHFAEGWTV